MTNLVRLYCGFLLIAILALSCEKDVQDDKYYTHQNNYLKVGDKEYDLSNGAIENYGQWEDHYWDFCGYNIDLTLLSDGATISTDSNGNREISGNGHAIYFEMFSATFNMFNNCDYIYHRSSSEPLPVGTFDCGKFYIIPSVDYENYCAVSITSGKVTINKKSDVYSITINCKNGNKVAITGFFEGPLLYFDYTDETKSAKPTTLKRNDWIKNDPIAL